MVDLTTLEVGDIVDFVNGNSFKVMNVRRLSIDTLSIEFNTKIQNPYYEKQSSYKYIFSIDGTYLRATREMPCGIDILRARKSTLQRFLKKHNL